ncbi:MAG: hypothetical protein M1825_003257 [Sarcosagium campestre]|nr:MAG: hypothetical protein M1825_003257 [Sarcosagium campestre]
MPKKGQSSRGSSSKKKTPAIVSAGDVDDSFIVFTNSKTDKKPPPPKPTTAENAKDPGQKAAAGPDGSATEDAPKRPDTRTLIGGSSWTGKLPLNMLSEHCQKQKWEKPEYTMSKTPEGFSSMVILKSKNPKTGETVSLPPFKLPPDHKQLAVQPSAVEARHFAATYGLFRVCNMRNIHMMLPPTYRELWKGVFQDLKKDDVKHGNGWMYEADPFVAKREREEAQASAAKKREAAQKPKAKEGGEPGAGNGHVPRVGANPGKGWSTVPKIDMGKKTRTEIEDLIRKHAVWNPYGHELSTAEKGNIVRDLSGLGFKASHIDEAVAYCSDREETLEWLLIHVPEDDLPTWTLPEGYVAGISMASANFKKEAAVKRLSMAGYAAELCERQYDTHAGDEGRTAEALQRLLMHGDEIANAMLASDLASVTLEPAEHGPGLAVWEEEQITLEAIYADRYKRPSRDVTQLRLEVVDTLRNNNTPRRMSLQVQRPLAAAYPAAVPTVSLLTEPTLPAYIRLSIIRKVAQQAESHFSGEPMIFLIVDWLEANVFDIIDKPCKLRDVAAVSSPIAELGTFSAPRAQNRPKKRPQRIDWRPDTPASQRLLAAWTARQATPAQQKMLNVRRSLPAWELRDDIVYAVNTHQVTIISGETGSGKSTQAVQFVLDDMIKRKLGAAANIVCTQPRRISALGLADRVSDERCMAVGQEVGYAIRGESKQTFGTTMITFVTTGVLLRKLQTSGGSSADIVAALADISHVVIDEVHERSLDTDFLLVLLRDVLKERRDLKLILMSATLDADVFEKYFARDGSVGKIEIQGRTFPVKDFYLDDILRKTAFGSSGKQSRYEDSESEDVDGGDDALIANKIQNAGMRINYDLIGETVRQIDAELGDEDGGILVFMPGTMEIGRTIDAIRSIPDVYALPLHASLLPQEQRRVFPAAPRGKRKVVVATNVAETSITIEDIVAVIDTGRVKETNFDPHSNIVKLEEVWASRSACKQRRGRAGRVRAGKCYKLYTRNAELTKMLERPIPEIKRVPLEQLCLSVKAMGVKDVPSFLGSALTPPASEAVEGALVLLERMGALKGEEMTALGRHLAMIPADLRCGKLMVYGATFGCLEACLSIAAILTVKSPFNAPQAKRDEAKQARAAFAKGQGDLVGDLRAYEEWSSMRGPAVHQRDVRAWCEQNFLSHYTLNDITSNRSHYLSSLKEIGFLPGQYHSSNVDSQKTYNAHNSNDALIRSLIAGAFSPQIARIGFPERKFAASMSGTVELDPEARTIKYFNQENGRVFVHPSSVLFDAQTFVGSADFMSYFNKMATSKVFIRDLTPFNAFTLLLFSGPITLDTLGRGLIVDGWMRLRGWARIGILVSRLRSMLDEVLARKIEQPEIQLADNEIVRISRRLIELNGMDR